MNNYFNALFDSVSEKTNFKLHQCMLQKITLSDELGANETPVASRLDST